MIGAIHDCTSRMCPCKGECDCCPLSDTVCSAGDTYLMNPTSNVSTNDFSPCSVSDICNTFPNIGYCLKCKFFFFTILHLVKCLAFNILYSTGFENGWYIFTLW